MSYDSMLQQALKLHQQNNLDAAELIYRQILQTAPNQPNILNLLGLIAQSRGLHNEAVSYFEKAIINDFNNFEYYFNLGWSLSAMGKYIEAETAYNKVIKLKPDTKEGYNALGEIYAIRGNNEKAAEMFNLALAYAPNYPEAMANLAYLKDDINELIKLKEKFSDNDTIPYYLSLLYREQKQYDEALKYAEDANKICPCENYKLLAGELCLQNNQKEQAGKYFKNAVEINPNSVTAIINLANLEKDSIQAEKMYKKALDVSPDNFDAHLNYANMLYQQNRLSEALEEYRKAVIINPASAVVSNNLGILHRSMGEYDEALGLFLNALNRDYNNKEYSLNIAETLILLYNKDKKLAKKIAENWLKSYPDNEFAKHINDSFKGKKSSSCSEYSKHLFDLFADNYEQVMNNINYNIPDAITEIVSPIKGTIIDLGCGTGLLGEKLKTADNKIIGIDISDKMLQKAKNKNIYEKLENADITEYCKNLPNADLVVAGDVLGYIGDVSDLIKNIYPHPFAFSVAIDKQSKSDYELTPSGRYVHNEKYINKILKQCGYKNIVSNDVILRSEDGKDVNGKIFYAKE